MFSARLRASRLDRGMTPTELGAAVGVSSRTIDRWERGVGEPGATQVARIAQILGSSVDELVNDTSPVPTA